MTDFVDLFDQPKAPIVVELDAYVIPDEHMVWKCSPGKTYRFYRAVRDAYTAFPDVRGLEKLGGDPNDWTDQQLLEAISDDRWEREVTSRERGNQPQGSKGISKADRGRLTFIKRLWFEAKKGDLVVIPADGYDKEVLIGELLSEPGELRRVEAEDGEYQGVYFGRAVAWKLAIPKLSLSEDLIKGLHTRAAVFPLGESRKAEIYRLVYKNFVYKGDYVAEFRTEKEHFTAEDAAVVAAWLNGFQVLHHSLEQNLDNRLEESFRSLALDELPDGAGADLKIKIQSPGEIFVRTKKPLALSLMVLFSLSGCSPDQVVDDGVTVHLKSVAGEAMNAQAAVTADVNGLTTALGEKRLKEANDLGQRAMRDAKMSTRGALKQAPKAGI